MFMSIFHPLAHSEKKEMQIQDIFCEVTESVIELRFKHSDV